MTHKGSIVSMSSPLVVLSSYSTTPRQLKCTCKAECIVSTLNRVLSLTLFSFKTLDQFAQAVVSLYSVYCWKIIQQRMLVCCSYTHIFHMFLKVALVSYYQIVWMKKIFICFHMFFKIWVSFGLSNCLNAKKIYIWNAKYILQHWIEHSQTTKCIQYNIHDTMSFELDTYIIGHYKPSVRIIDLQFKFDSER